MTDAQPEPPAREIETEHQRLLRQMCEANERLVLATLRADLLAEEANAAREKAESSDQASRAKDEFLAMLGHELRNPLAPIVTLLQLMRLRGETALEKERTVIERHVSHLVRLVEDLLDVARITGGKVSLRKHRLELADAVARAIEMSSPLLEQHRHRLVVEVPESGLAVDADPHRLAQIVSNLLNNAAKYTEPGGVVTLVGERSGETVSLRVRDTGIGIEPEIAARIFDRFVQAPQALDRAEGGLGLGLAIVERLVSMHGGQVSVHSEGKGKGAEFRVVLPAAAEGARDGAQPGGPPPQRANSAGKLVLIVDDNDDAAEMLAMTLESLGFRTAVARDGRSALQLIEAEAPEIALLDIGLPVMDGYELAAALRQRPGLEKLRLIAITGYGQASHRQRSAAAGFDAHLVKPIDADDLLAALRGSRAHDPA